jgi:hypothetical protein
VGSGVMAGPQLNNRTVADPQMSNSSACSSDE